MEDWNSEDPSDAMVEEEEIPDIVMQTIQSQDNEKLIPPWAHGPHGASGGKFLIKLVKNTVRELANASERAGSS